MGGMEVISRAEWKDRVHAKNSVWPESGSSRVPYADCETVGESMATLLTSKKLPEEGMDRPDTRRHRRKGIS
jgi:hypothetical protein